MRTYLDHNATSPLRPEARDAMIAAMDMAANASSVHREGRKAQALIETARDTIAKSLGVISPGVIFTSGGSESCNHAIRGVNVDRVLVSSIEHPCVLEAAKASGKLTSLIPVDSNGIIDLAALDTLLRDGQGRALVSVMLANNETGVIQPIRDIVALAQKHDALVHTDCVQAFGKVPVNFGLLGVDMLSVSAHKLGGPQGIGALVVRDGLPVTPLIAGGGQELRRRAGTENVAAIAGFAAAVATSSNDATHGNSSNISKLRDQLESSLKGHGLDITVFSSSVDRLPNTVCFSADGLSAEMLVMAFDLQGVAVSSGSACSSGKVQASHVLSAMEVKDELANGAIRVSLGWSTTVHDINRFSEVWQHIAARHCARAA
ncbi:MAG: cysteine desulfurase family protein [Anderseniella sp.]